jgi:hypothetical protein
MEFPCILDTDYVLRRIYRHHIKGDGSLKSTSFSSFSDDDNPSCHLEKLTTISNILRDNEEVVCLAKLNVGEIRELGLELCHEPTAEDYSHCVICKRPNNNMNEKKIRKKLVSIAQIIEV